MSAPMFEKICLIGSGLIGSSIMRAAREKKLAGIIAATEASVEADGILVLD